MEPITPQNVFSLTNLVREWSRYDKKSFFSVVTTTTYEGIVAKTRIVATAVDILYFIKKYNVSVYLDKDLIGECDSKKHPQYSLNLQTCIENIEDKHRQQTESVLEKKISDSKK